MRPEGRFQSSRLLLLLTAMAMGGCGQTPNEPSPSDAPREPGTATQSGILIPVNVLFSAPGSYAAPTGDFVLKIVREPEGQVRYSVQPGVSPTYSLSEKDLMMCWDRQGRLWIYHPMDFIHFHEIKEASILRVFCGDGRDVLHEMPSAFRENLPEDIGDVFDNAVAASPDGVLQIPMTDRLSTTQGPAPRDTVNPLSPEEVAEVQQALFDLRAGMEMQEALTILRKTQLKHAPPARSGGPAHRHHTTYDLRQGVRLILTFDHTEEPPCFVSAKQLGEGWAQN